MFACKGVRIAGAGFAAAVLVAGCGTGEGAGGGGERAEAVPDGQPEVPEVPEEDGADEEVDGGMTGVWESVADGNEVQTLTISGNEVVTSGPLSCPGSLNTRNGVSSITLECAAENEFRERGRIEMPDRRRLFIIWEGENQRTRVDNFTKTGREPDFTAPGT
ncbi:hypothetical protein [Allosalinactinospora lopnorensis]|uniref:hypothetical protein n=1 Tax=Allosalinactinospora lopnorensis TaxID=1352348 RepID=UPI000623F1AD|nr:hypothetical protein [Allosalinactinospora lopnorensis]